MHFMIIVSLTHIEIENKLSYCKCINKNNNIFVCFIRFDSFLHKKTWEENKYYILFNIFPPNFHT